MVAVESSPEFVAAAYERMEKNVAEARRKLGRPMTLTEKILYGHLADVNQAVERGKSYLQLRPDRVAMQDATAQMALLQFSSAGIETVQTPTTVHCDHLIIALAGAKADLQTAVHANREVYDFLRTASARYGIGFWHPGSGIIHQVLLENYAFPGGLMIGTDSHTPNAGGLGMFASGVGGADAAEVMAGLPWEVLAPKIIGVKLVGELRGWTSPKDVILLLCGLLTVKGGTNAVIEYFGPGCESISCTGKATITNMGAELGATTSVFPFDRRMATYLEATERAQLANLAQKHGNLLRADPEVEQAPEKFYDKVVTIDLSKLEPHLVGPHTPDLARPVSVVKEAARKENYPDHIRVALIGSCTNSSYEDIVRAASVADQAAKAGMRAAIPLLVTPGSEQVRATIERDGLIQKFEALGGKVLANACGPCIGQWSRPDLGKEEKNVIITSYNRNFPGRNDGNTNTLAFMGSPEVVMAYALTGKLSVDPLHDEIHVDGKTLRLTPPPVAPEVPPDGFVRNLTGYVAPPADRTKVQVLIPPTSDRLQRLEPFAPWDGKDYVDLPVLVKAKGKCTTDHISPAGPWLKYRGHLDRISDNAFLGVNNAFLDGKAGRTVNVLTKQEDDTPKVARAYRNARTRWVVVGDENYGEGSSREHAAMSPRYLGCAAVLARSFARIHETNLKKQGILPLTFSNPADYDLVRPETKVSLQGLNRLAPGAPVRVVLKQGNGATQEIHARHTLNAEQVEWFRAGSALNMMRAKAANRKR